VLLGGARDLAGRGRRSEARQLLARAEEKARDYKLPEVLGSVGFERVLVESWLGGEQIGIGLEALDDAAGSERLAEWDRPVVLALRQVARGLAANHRGDRQALAEARAGLAPGAPPGVQAAFGLVESQAARGERAGPVELPFFGLHSMGSSGCPAACDPTSHGRLELARRAATGRFWTDADPDLPRPPR
jgi:hypothetical protein